MVWSVSKWEADGSKCATFLQIVLIWWLPRIWNADLSQYQSGNCVNLELVLYLLEKSNFIFRPDGLAFGLRKWGGLTVNVQGAATDGYPVLYDIFFLVQYLLDIKDKFILPVNWRSLIEQNGNYQQAYFRRSRGVGNKIKTHFIEILIIIALARNKGCTISTDREFLFQKRLSLRSFLLGS